MNLHARFFSISSFRMSLRYKIILLFVLAIVLPAILISFAVTSISRESVRNLIYDQQREALRLVAEKINPQIQRHMQLLEINRSMGQMLAGKQISLARGILQQGDAFSEIVLIDIYGREQWKCRRDGIVMSHGRLPQPVPLVKKYISPVYLSGDRHPFIWLSVSLSSGRGMLAGKLELGQMWKWISEVKIGETGHAFVVDRKGNLIAHREPERVWAHSNFKELPIVKDFFNKSQSSPEDWREYLDERGEKVVSLYEPLPDLGWAVISQIPSKEVYRPIAEMRRSVFLWTIFWTGVFLVVGVKFVQRITNPLAELQKGVQKISQGKLDIALNIKTGDEIGELAENIEKMAQDLKQLEELRQDLIRMIIHDLKSPLSGIMGSLDYLECGMLGPLEPDQKKILTLAKKSSETMLSMIQNLLDIAKMEEGKLELQKEKVEMRELLRERLGQFEALAITEKKTVILNIAQNVPPAFIDRHLIERVINNLLSNALHHTSMGGKINLGLKANGNAIEVSVSDDGVGIPPEYKDKIFEKFVQVQKKQHHLRTGAGLGLTFCKMVVESHGGAIHVESELNKGSSFIFDLPI